MFEDPSGIVVTQYLIVVWSSDLEEPINDLFFKLLIAIITVQLCSFVKISSIRFKFTLKKREWTSIDLWAHATISNGNDFWQFQRNLHTLMRQTGNMTFTTSNWRYFTNNIQSLEESNMLVKQHKTNERAYLVFKNIGCLCRYWWHAPMILTSYSCIVLFYGYLSLFYINECRVCIRCTLEMWSS